MLQPQHSCREALVRTFCGYAPAEQGPCTGSSCEVACDTSRPGVKREATMVECHRSGTSTETPAMYSCTVRWDSHCIVQ